MFLDDADQGGELWFPDLNIAVPPKAGTLVIYANVKRDAVWNLHAIEQMLLRR